MNKNLIRILAVILIISPWIYIDNTYKEVATILIAIVILIATVGTKKKILPKDQPTATATDTKSN